MKIRLEGGEELAKELQKLGGAALRRAAMQAVKQATLPIRAAAKRLTPVSSRRLRSSIGLLVRAHKLRDGVTGRVGFRRDFTFVSADKQRMVSGAGKTREKGLAKGLQGDTKQVNQYAAKIEFGTDIKGNISRDSGGAFMLNRAIISQRAVAIGAVARTLKQFIDR
jgi:hypothetical protein